MKHIVEVHSHIIPGVDDGARDMKTAMAMLESYVSQGVDRIICTPHYRPGYAASSYERIMKQYDALIDEADAGGFGGKVLIYTGCEVHDVADAVDGLREGRISTMAGSRYVLIEFSESTYYQKMRATVKKLQMAGYIPIVAHAERYEETVKHIEYVEELIDEGAFIQINSASVMGELGRGIAKYCRKLMQDQLVHFIGSDAHNMSERKPALSDCAEYIEKKYGSTYANRLFIENPEAILYSQLPTT